MKRYLPWILIGFAALMLLVAGVSVAGYFLFRQANPATDDEKTALKRLEKNYDAKHKLDDKFRVVRLELEGPHVDDEAIDDVVKLKYLKEISLAKSSVTDVGMDKLRALKRLEHLGITDTRVTDTGLQHLEKIPALRFLWVCESAKLTKEGVASLKQSLPGLTVYVMNQP
jgi:hypothetical protein